MKMNKNLKIFIVVILLVGILFTSTIYYKKNISYSAESIIPFEDLTINKFIPFNTTITVAQKHHGYSSSSYGHVYLAYCDDEISVEECSNKIKEAEEGGYWQYDWSSFDDEHAKVQILEEGNNSNLSSYITKNYSDLFESSNQYKGWRVVETADVGDNDEENEYNFSNMATAGVILYPTNDEIVKDGTPSISNDYETCVKCNDKIASTTEWYKFESIDLKVYNSSNKIIGGNENKLKETDVISVYDSSISKIHLDSIELKKGQIISMKMRGTNDSVEVSNENNDFLYLYPQTYSQLSLFNKFLTEIETDGSYYIDSYYNSYGEYVEIKEYGILTPINTGDKLDKSAVQDGDIIYYVSKCDNGFKWDGFTEYIAPESYNVTYDGNNATSGEVPIDNNIYLSGSEYTVLNNSGNLKKENATFAGWSKTAIKEIINSENSNVIEPNSKDIINSNITLYAVYCTDKNNNSICDYKETLHNITYDKGLSTSGTVPLDSNKYLSGLEYQVKDNTGKLNMEKATFDGWSLTNLDSIITSHYENTIEPNEIKVMGDNDITLYAIFAEDLNENEIADYKEDKYNVVYNKGLATTGNIPIDSNKYLSGLEYQVKDNTGKLDMEKATFDGWSLTKLDNVITSHYENTIEPNEVKVMGNSGVNLYAIFAEDLNENEIADYKEDKYKVIYHEGVATSGTVPLDNNLYLTKLSAKIKDNTGNLKKDNAKFIGWSLTKLELLTNSNVSETIYNKNNSVLINNSNIDLYAVFCIDENNNNICDYNEDGYSIIYNKNTATYGNAPIDVTKYLENTNYKLKDNEGNLGAEKAVFDGWSTKQLPVIKEHDDSIIEPFTELTIKNNDITYFAVLAEDINDNKIADYKENKYQIIYDGNGATSGEVPVDNNKYLTLLNYEVMNNTGNLKKDNASFIGWSLKKLDDQTSIPDNIIEPGTKETINDSNVIYYAVWQKKDEVKNPNTKSFIISAIIIFAIVSLILIIISNKKIIKYE